MRVFVLACFIVAVREFGVLPPSFQRGIRLANFQEPISKKLDGLADPILRKAYKVVRAGR